MGNKRVMVPADEVDLTVVKYEPEVIQGVCSSILHFPILQSKFESCGI